MTARSPEWRLTHAVGAEVRKQREARALTQAQLGALAQMGTSEISRLESGLRSPRLTTLVTVIEGGLGMPLGRFWVGVDARRSGARRAA